MLKTKGYMLDDQLICYGGDILITESEGDIKPHKFHMEGEKSKIRTREQIK